MLTKQTMPLRLPNQHAIEPSKNGVKDHIGTIAMMPYLTGAFSVLARNTPALALYQHKVDKPEA